LNLLIVALVKTLVQIIKPSHKGENLMFRNIKKVLALACVTVAVGAVAIPSLVSAQNNNPNRTEKMQKRQDAFKQLNLTEAQKTQMKAIRESAKTRRQSVLTAEQRAIMEQARQSGDRKGVKKSLNLTDAQKQQMKAIGEDTKAQIKNVLTPAQQQQLEQMKQQRQANRGTMRQGNSR
jgi:Spy/CpxP family protein refolding chaperone